MYIWAFQGNFYEYHKDVEYVDEWGILATANAGDHQEYLTMIPQEQKDQVKDYFKNRKKKWSIYCLIRIILLLWHSLCLTRKLFLKNLAGQAPQLNWGLMALLTVDLCLFFKWVSRNAFSAKAISQRLHLNNFGMVGIGLFTFLRTVVTDPDESEFDEYVEAVRLSSSSEVKTIGTGGSGWGTPLYDGLCSDL